LKPKPFIYLKCLDCPDTKENLFLIPPEEKQGFTCPICGGVNISTPPWWYVNLVDAWRSGKGGPKTQKGKARSAINSITHGKYSHTAYYPAKPGKYPECENCPYREICEKEKKICYKRNEKILKYVYALEYGDMSPISEEAGVKLAKLDILMDQIYHEIMEEGLTQEVIGMTQKGDEWVKEKKANPLLLELRAIAKDLGYTSTDWNLTKKSQKETKYLDDLAGSFKEKELKKVKEDMMARVMEVMEKKEKEPDGRTDD